MAQAVFAMTAKDRVVGAGGSLPWLRLPADMKRFVSITESHPLNRFMNVVVMGRKTWESLPRRSKPLPNRFNAVVTSQTEETLELPSGVMRIPSLEDPHKVIDDIREHFPFAKNVMIIGGPSILMPLLPIINKLHITYVAGLPRLTKNTNRTKMPYIGKFFRFRKADICAVRGSPCMTSDGKRVRVDLTFLTADVKYRTSSCGSIGSTTSSEQSWVVFDQPESLPDLGSYCELDSASDTKLTAKGISKA